MTTNFYVDDEPVEEMEADKRRRIDHGPSLQVDRESSLRDRSAENPSPPDLDISTLEADDTVNPHEDFQFSYASRMPFDSSSTYPGAQRYRGRPRPYDAETLTSTCSLYERDIPYAIENNRRYVTNYYMPNDENEQDRLRITHQVFLNLFDGKLTTIPLHDPTRVLDIGTGTGEWAIEMGEEYPDADVIGTDLSPIQPTAVPENVFFEVDDAENEIGWTYTPDSFDLIHFRNMRGAFSNWRNIYEQTLKFLKPGGWVEVVDFDDLKSVAHHLGPNSKMHEYLEALDEAGRKAGRPRSSTHLRAEALSELGFTSTHLTSHSIALGPWPEDPRERDMGTMWLLAVLEGFEAAGMRLLTQELQWTTTQVKSLCRELTKEVKALALDRERARGFGVKVKVLIGQRPLNSNSTEPSPSIGLGLEVDDEPNDEMDLL